jgi:hypothetical protein
LPLTPALRTPDASSATAFPDLPVTESGTNRPVKRELARETTAAENDPSATHCPDVAAAKPPLARTLEVAHCDEWPLRPSAERTWVGA